MGKCKHLGEFLRAQRSKEAPAKYRLTDAERDAIHRGLAEMREGRLASDDAVAAVFDRYRG
jgi:hypothetical protein